jgi:hypothetical protein
MIKLRHLGVAAIASLAVMACVAPTAQASPGSLYIEGLNGSAPFYFQSEHSGEHEYQISSQAGDTFTFGSKFGAAECDAVMHTEYSGEWTTANLPLDAEFSSCIQSNGQDPGLVDMNSCRFENGLLWGPPYSSPGSWHSSLEIVCDETGDAIEYKAYLGTKYEAQVCNVAIGPQSLSKVVYTNLDESPYWVVTMDVNVSNVKHHISGLCVSTPETRTDMTFTWDTVLGVNPYQ